MYYRKKTPNTQTTIQSVNDEQLSFINELEEEFNMTIDELEGYYAEAKRLKIIRGKR